MSVYLSHPLPGSRPTGGFGWRPAFTENGVHVPAMLHNGQDYGANSGTPILAAHDGKVIWNAWDNLGGGWGVQILHPNGWSTLYLHMRERSTHVAVGQNVRAGQTIGRVGATGLATGAHLHFMLRLNGVDVDPVPYIGKKPASTKKSAAQIAKEIVNGVNGVNPWGNDPIRSQRIREAGGDPVAVSAEVAKLLKAPAPAKKPDAAVAQEIWEGRGGWGNGNDRVTKLRAAGYDPVKVQDLVNKLAKPRTYTVKRGDTLSGIAAKFGTTWQTLQKMNGIANANLINPGQVIRLP